MKKDQAILDFVDQWLSVLLKLDEPTEALLDSEFVWQCQKLHFDQPTLDLDAAFPIEQPMMSLTGLKKIISKINDKMMLGHAIYRQWQNWQAKPADSQKAWLIAALQQLKKLALANESLPFVFHGVIAHLELISQAATNSPANVQWLKLGRNGKAELRIMNDQYKLLTTQTENLKGPQLNVFFEKLALYFAKRHDFKPTNIENEWQLTLTATNGQKFQTHGYWLTDATLGELAQELRQIWNGDAKLWLFDGLVHAEKIDRLTIRYHRQLNAYQEDGEPVQLDYLESIVIDRARQDLIYRKHLSDDCAMEHRYHIANAIDALLDVLQTPDFLAYVNGNDDDVVFDPDDQRRYAIEIQTAAGQTRIINGSFDKQGLPVDFPKLAMIIEDFLSFYGNNELIDPALYNHQWRRPGQYIYCDVSFEEDGRTYCYRTEDERLAEGDLVRVPVGRDNHLAIGRIERIQIVDGQHVPYPLSKTKLIIGPYQADED